jgi:hypothetical protein
MKEIVISNLMRAKNKQSFFALHQVQTKIKTLYPDIRLEFHILWDDTNELNAEEEHKWSTLIDEKIENLHSYSKEFFDKYLTEFCDLDYVDRFKKFKAGYFIVMGHYLRRVLLKHYYLIYDDDILINDNFKVITDSMLDNTAVLITEPMNSSCDKVMFEKLVQLLGIEFSEIYRQKNPNLYGFNAGFQGIDLKMYDLFLSPDRLETLLSLFDYSGIYDENGEQIWGNKRFLIDTQQQSMISLMNVVFSVKPIHILNPEEYYVVPNFGNHPVYGELDPEGENGGWTAGLNSKITHFIGHTNGKSKPKEFLTRVDEYLTNNKFEI